MSILKTRIILRNDTSTNWLTNETQILLKGEVGIEFLTDGTAKIKIGDGTNTWADLDYFGGDINLTGDGNSISIGTDGTISLLGLEDAVEGAQLLKQADGTIAWIKPDTTTVEGLSTSVATLETNIAALQTDLDTLESVVGDATSGLVKDVAEKANSADVYTKTDTDSAIAAAVAAAEHLKRKIVTGVDDIDIAATDASQYIYLVPKDESADGDSYDEYMVINGLLERVGDWKVDLSTYATTEDVNAGLALKVDTIEGKGLSTNDLTDELLAKINGMSEGAQVNVLEAVKINGTVLTIIDKSVDIPVGGADTLGVVKSSEEENKITVDTNGIMEVNNINVNKLVQSESETLILDGGSSAL